jgi:hypothetical protein
VMPMRLFWQLAFVPSVVLAVLTAIGWMVRVPVIDAASRLADRRLVPRHGPVEAWPRRWYDWRRLRRGFGRIGLALGAWLAASIPPLAYAVQLALVNLWLGAACVLAALMVPGWLLRWATRAITRETHRLRSGHHPACLPLPPPVAAVVALSVVRWRMSRRYVQVVTVLALAAPATLAMSRIPSWRRGADRALADNSLADEAILFGLVTAVIVVLSYFTLLLKWIDFLDPAGPMLAAGEHLAAWSRSRDVTISTRWEPAVLHRGGHLRTYGTAVRALAARAGRRQSPEAKRAMAAAADRLAGEVARTVTENTFPAGTMRRASQQALSPDLLAEAVRSYQVPDRSAKQGLAIAAWSLVVAVLSGLATFVGTGVALWEGLR